MLAGASDGGEDDGGPPWGEGPPRFLVPPPPAPPSSAACRSPSPADLHFCQLEPVGAEFTQTAFPSLPIIAVCSSVVLVAVLVASFLLWKHKRKVQNFLPCKTQHQGRCDGGAGGITYDDVLINHHPTRLPLNADTLTPIELLDVKYGNYVQQHADPLTRTNFTIPTGGIPLQQQQQQQLLLQQQQQQQQQLNNHQQQHSNHRNGNNGGRERRHRGKKPFHPIYEEVSDKGGCDSDIDDDSRTVASEDEFAEDELSVAGLNPGSATSSLQGSTGGDLYPDEAAPQERTLKDRTQFRDLNKLTHSLERNKDGHPSNSFQAKQNYYLNKSMLGPDFTYPDGEPCVSPSSGDMQQDEQYPQRGMGSSLNFIPALLQQQQQRGGPASRSASNSPPPPPYGGQGVISALYNPQVVSPGSQQRIPDALLRELTFKMPGGNGQVAAMSSRSLPVPPSCRGGGVLFTVESPYPPIQQPQQQLQQQHQQQSPFPSMSRARSGSATEFTPPRAGGYYRPPTPPPPENIYASIDDVGPYTIDGRHGRSHPQQQRKGAELRNTFGRPGRASKGSSSADPKYHPPANNVSNRSDESQAYGDIRPIYDARTACS